MSTINRHPQEDPDNITKVMVIIIVVLCIADILYQNFIH